MINPDNVFEVFIKIGHPDLIKYGRHIEVYRSRVIPFLEKLAENLVWYSVLIHDKSTGHIPMTEDDVSWFWHLRVSLDEAVSLDDFTQCLDKDMIAKEGKLESISGLYAGFYELDDPLIAWELLGDISKAFTEMVRKHKQEVPGKYLQIQFRQFNHFLDNMVQ
jgi:hypothetical protein